MRNMEEKKMTKFSDVVNKFSQAISIPTGIYMDQNGNKFIWFKNHDEHVDVLNDEYLEDTLSKVWA